MISDTAVSDTEWYRQLLIRICAAVFIIVSILFFMPPDAAGRENYFLALGSVLIATLLGAWLGWQQHVRAGATLLALVMFLAAAFLMFRFPEFRDVLVGGQVTVILLVSLFLGKWAGTWWGAANILLLGGLYMMERSEWIAARQGSVGSAVGREIAVILFSTLLIRWWTDSARQQARLLRQREHRYYTRFAASPIPLWEIDCSRAIRRLQFWQEEIGFDDVHSYFRAQPQDVARLAHLVRVRDVNDAALKLYKATHKDELLGSLDRILPEESYERFVEELLQIAAGCSLIRGETVHETLDGKQIEVAVTCTIVPGHEERGEQVMMAVRDITSQKHTQRESLAYIERIRLQQKLDHAILSAEAPADIAKSGLQQLRPLVPFWSGGVVLFDFEREEFEVLAVHSLAPLDLETGVRRPLSNISFAFDLAQQPYYLSHELPRTKEMEAITQILAKHRLETLLYVPLICRDAYVGLLVLAARPKGTFSKEAIQIVREVADPLAIAIHNAHTLRSEKTARRQAETLQEVAALLNKDIDLDEVLDTILTRLTEVVEADSKAILLLSDASIYIAAYQDASEALQLLAAEQMENWQNIQAVIRSGEPVIIPDTQADPTWNALPGMEHIRSWMGIPLSVKGKIIGLFSLDHRKPNFYTPADAKLAMAFAHHAALVIEKVRLFNQVQAYADQLEQRVGERTRELRTLYQVTAVTVEHLELQSILQSALGRALDALDGSAGAIHLETEEGWRLHAQQGLSPALQTTLSALPADHPLLSQVTADDSPQLFTTLTTPSLSTSHGWQDVQTCVGAPMHAQGRTVGVFSIFGREPLLYTGEEIALIASIADQVGIAVENADLHRQAEDTAVLRERQRLSRELHDSVAQTLYGIKLYAEAVRAQAQAAQWEEANVTGDRLTALAQQAMREMRLLLYQLRERDALQKGLSSALRERLNMVEERGEIKVDFPQQEVGRLPLEIEKALFWAAQEALNNVIKHSEATAVSIYFIPTPDNHLTLIIEDNGVGFIPTWQSDGMGIGNMQDRILEIGGALALSSWPGMGAQVQFQVQLGNSTV